MHHCHHLTIASYESSQSLKNDLSIQQALEKYTSKQIRLTCLLTLWLPTHDYNDHEMEKALNYEKMVNDFIINIDKHIEPFDQFNNADDYMKFSEHDRILSEYFFKTKNQVHLALCDCIDTPSVMENICQLISTAQIYIKKENSAMNPFLLKDIAGYITYLFNIFGLNHTS